MRLVAHSLLWDRITIVCRPKAPLRIADVQML